MKSAFGPEQDALFEDFFALVESCGDDRVNMALFALGCIGPQNRQPDDVDYVDVLRRRMSSLVMSGMTPTFLVGGLLSYLDRIVNAYQDIAEGEANVKMAYNLMQERIGTEGFPFTQEQLDDFLERMTATPDDVKNRWAWGESYRAARERVSDERIARVEQILPPQS